MNNIWGEHVFKGHSAPTATCHYLLEFTIKLVGYQLINLLLLLSALIITYYVEILIKSY